MVDGTAVAYRSFHAIRGLSASDGTPTNAAYGAVNSVRRWLRLHEPAHGAVVFDRGMPEYRLQTLETYKAQRPPMPDDLEAQLPVIEELIDALGLSVVVQEGIEADDVIARLAMDAVEAGASVVVVSSDKDMLPLIEHGVRIVLPHRENEACDAGYVRERYGVPPERIVDWLALVGDASDNIPGVPGVGAKTAARLLQEFGSAEELLAGAGRIGNARVRAAVEAHRDAVLRNLELVRLRPEIVRPVPAADLRVRAPDRSRLEALFRRLEFGGMLRELLQGGGEAGAGAETPPRASGGSEQGILPLGG